MYEFLYQEKFWMQTIIGAVATTIGTIIVAIITYHYKIRKVFHDIVEIKRHEGLTEEDRDLTKEHGDLAKEHEDLSKEHHTLSKDHDKIFKGYEQIIGSIKDSSENLLRHIDETKEITNKIKDIVSETKVKDDERYGNLTDTQKRIIDSVNNLNEFAAEIKRLQEDKLRLIVENESLKNKCQDLSIENAKLVRSMRSKERGRDNELEEEMDI